MKPPTDFMTITRLFKRTWGATLSFIGTVALYFLIRDPQGPEGELLQHIMLTVAAVMGVHLLDRLFLFRDTRDSFAEIAKDITRDVQTETVSLAKQSDAIKESLASVRQEITGSVKIETNRLASQSNAISQSLTDIAQDITGNVKAETERLASQSNAISQSLTDIAEDITGSVKIETERLSKQSDAILRETSKLAEQSASIAAMAQSGIARLYASRSDACLDMMQDLLNPSNTSIRLIGISLNDILRGDQPVLNRAWRAIRSWIKDAEHKRVDDHLDIRVLIIDPNCFGAQLRSSGEIRDDPTIPGRLATDVEAVTPHLVALEEIAKANFSKTHISFACRLYQLPPIMFLCHVDSFCYVQQYHFWSNRLSSTSIPMLKYHKEHRGSSSPVSHPEEREEYQSYPMHEEMSKHFDWIWDNASIPVANYVSGAVVGTDQGIHLSGAVNIYTDPDKAAERILCLLRNAQDTVAIQGISLASFIRPGALLNAITQLVEAGKVKIRLLLLDPDCEQAQYRGYRERLFIDASLTFDQYKQDPAYHTSSALYQDTMRTIDEILTKFGSRTGSGPRVLPPNLDVRLYDSAPGCFMLQVDDHILVEQYHYGKKVSGKAPMILGKDMPLVEYIDAAPYPASLYGTITPLPQRPLALLEDHFDFAFKQARPL